MPNIGDLETILEQAERNQERLAGFLRIVVFVSLLVTVLSVRQQGGHHHPLLAATLAYGALSLAGIWLAWRQIYHRWIPYLFVTCEVALLAAQVVLLGRLMEVPREMGVAVPIAGLIYVLLVHAAMRYRPWLVVYGAVLFAVGIGIGRFLIGSPEAMAAHEMHMGDQPFHQFFHYEVFPVVTLGLTTFILVVTSRGTRRLLRQSLENTIRVARLSRFFPAELASSLATDGHEALMQGGRRPVTVLFADIRGFSALAEQMDPETLGEFITDFRERTVQDIENWGGVVDKFIGDAVMAVFGIPESRPDDAHRALGCALDMVQSIERWSGDRLDAGQPGVAIGVGLHHGEVFAGVLGRDHLLEFTVIGDTVNVAERLERLTRSLDADVVASSDLVASAGIRVPMPPWRLADECHLPGREQTLDVLYLPRGMARHRLEVEAVEGVAERALSLAPTALPDRV